MVEWAAHSLHTATERRVICGGGALPFACVTIKWLMTDKRQTNRLLGYPADARLLIINADDFGMCHAINAAIFHALQKGVLRSTTLMVPCPWALHAMHWLADHPEVPFGVHLTVISDWADYRWGPLTSREKVPSLIDQAGYFYDFEHMPELLAQVELDQLEMEFRAQLDAVLATGLKPTHLDRCVSAAGRIFLI
jgi:hypothetical protein